MWEGFSGALALAAAARIFGAERIADPSESPPQPLALEILGLRDLLEPPASERPVLTITHAGRFLHEFADPSDGLYSDEEVASARASILAQLEQAQDHAILGAYPEAGRAPIVLMDKAAAMGPTEQGLAMLESIFGSYNRLVFDLNERVLDTLDVIKRLPPPDLSSTRTVKPHPSPQTPEEAAYRRPGTSPRRMARKAAQLAAKNF